MNATGPDPFLMHSLLSATRRVEIIDASGLNHYTAARRAKTISAGGTENDCILYTRRPAAAIRAARE
jgi:hypothetical protein